MGWKVCSTAGCANIIDDTESKCLECRRRKDRRRTRVRNPYNTAGHQGFRRQVLARDPRCVCPGAVDHDGCGKHVGMCARPSTVADHYPYERTELIELGLNPNDPRYGRGLCARCHDTKTGLTRPSGFRAQ